MSKNKSYEKYFDWNKYKRVVKLAKTPDRADFYKVAKIVVASVFAVGLLGFMIFQLMGFIPM